MGKEKNKGNKETKKPKKEVVKVLATIRLPYARHT